MDTYLSLKFKSQRERDEFSQIHERLKFILNDMARWVDAHGYSFIVTDLLSDAFSDKRLGRISTSHLEGRAADVSIQGWPVDFQKKFEAFFESAYKNEAAFSKRTMQNNLIEIHDNGNGAHAHIQIRPGL